MEWDDYYEKFYDWANSTQISRFSKLTSFGSADEICEVAIQLCDDVAATRLIKKAVSSGTVFNAHQIIELIDALNEDGMNCAILACKCSFTREQLDDLYGAVSDDILEQAAARSGINFFGDEDPDPGEVDDEYPVEQENVPRIGFWGKLAIALGIASLDNQQNKHNGRCNGDCAHCPPHYGYRYGRWYYGHNHQHGCEFGGNKGL
jgi:hypothetical protein